MGTLRLLLSFENYFKQLGQKLKDRFQKMSTASHAFVDQLQSRYWCITWNNPTVAGEELEKHLAGNPNIKEFAFQLEKGESGTKHFQIYVAYTTNQRGKRMRETWPGCHIDIRRGKREQAIAYCSQDEYEGVSKGRIEGPWIKLSQEQGKRNDLLAVKEKLDKGADMIDEVSWLRWGRYPPPPPTK